MDMDKDTLHKVALSLLAYHKAKTGLKTPDIVTDERAVEIVKEEIREKDWPAILYGGETNDLQGMAKLLGAPEAEYFDFCSEICWQMMNEAQYLKPAGTLGPILDKIV